MMKATLVMMLCGLCAVSFGQNGWTRPNVSYGFRYYGIGVDSAFFFPTGSGAPTRLGRSDLHQGALYFDSTNNKLYTYNPSTTTWSAVGGGAPETLQTVTERGDTTDGYINITGNARYGLDGREGLMLSYNRDERSSYIESYNDVSGKFHPLILSGNAGESASAFVNNSLKISDDVYFNNKGLWYSQSPNLPGSNTQIMYRNSTNMIGSADFTFSAATTSQLSIGTSVSSNNANINGGGGSGYLSVTPGSGGFRIVGVGSGTTNDSVLMREISTGKVTQVSSGRILANENLQTVTNRGAVTTNSVVFGTSLGSANVVMNYSNASQDVVSIQNTNTTNGTSGLTVNTASTGGSTAIFSANSGSVTKFQVRGDGTNYMYGDLFINNNNVHMQDGEVGRHLYFVNSTPTMTLASGASWTGTYSITGTDQSGVIALTISSGTGSVGASGNLFNISFGSTFSAHNANVIVTARDITTANAFDKIAGTTGTTTGWILSTTPSLSGIPAGQYFFTYHVF